VREIPVIARADGMLDRDGRVLWITSGLQHTVIAGKIRFLSKNISPGLPMVLAFDGDLREQLTNTKSLPKFQPIIIKPRLSVADIAFIESQYDIPVLEMICRFTAPLLPNGFLAHAVGYVGEVSDSKIEASNGKLRMGDLPGRFASNGNTNDILMAPNGKRRVSSTASARKSALADPGIRSRQQIQLTIDYDLQQMAEQSLGRAGARWSH